MRPEVHRTHKAAGRLLWRARYLAPAVVAVTGGLLVVSVAAPAPAHAIDLFPVDDWIGDGLKSVGKVALGPLKFGAKQIAQLLASIIGALADLLIPKSLINSGVKAIKWLVELPALGTSPRAPAGVTSVRMPHLQELRDTLTWIGLTLMPLQMVLAGGRALLSPSADGDAPTEVLQRTIAAAVGLLTFDLVWGALTQLVKLLTDSLLSLPWVADGVRRMLQSLVIGGATGTAVAAEFVIPLLLTIAGAILLALVLLRVGLEVVASIVYVTGGLALGLSVSGAGHRLLQAWMVAAAAVFVLPVLWCVVFVTGAALMVDAGSTGRSGLGDFVGQLYNVGAAIVTFGIAIKLARVTLGHAGTAIAGLGATAKFGGAGGLRGGRAGAPAFAMAGAVATPQSLTRFSQNLRGGMRSTAGGAVRAGTSPIRRPVMAAVRLHSQRRAPTAHGGEDRPTAERGAKAGRRDADGTERSGPTTKRGGQDAQARGQRSASESRAARPQRPRSSNAGSAPSGRALAADPATRRPTPPAKAHAPIGKQPPSRGAAPAADTAPAAKPPAPPPPRSSAGEQVARAPRSAAKHNPKRSTKRKRKRP